MGYPMALHCWDPMAAWVFIHAVLTTPPHSIPSVGPLLCLYVLPALHVLALSLFSIIGGSIPHCHGTAAGTGRNVGVVSQVSPHFPHFSVLFYFLTYDFWNAIGSSFHNSHI